MLGLTGLLERLPRAIRLAKECMNGIELLDVKTSYRFEQGFTLERPAAYDPARPVLVALAIMNLF